MKKYIVIILIATLLFLGGYLLWKNINKNKIPYLPGRSIPIEKTVEAGNTGE